MAAGRLTAIFRAPSRHLPPLPDCSGATFGDCAARNKRPRATQCYVAPSQSRAGPAFSPLPGADQDLSAFWFFLWRSPLPHANPPWVRLLSKPIVAPPSAAQPPTSSPAPLPPTVAAKSLDLNPLDRSTDRLLAARWLLDDAHPMFCQRAESAAGRSSGRHSCAPRQWPALHGGENLRQLRLRILRTAHHPAGLCALALLRISRPEALKEYSPENWVV